MNALAQLIGYAVIILGGCTLCAYLVAISLKALWSAYRKVLDYNDLTQALREYREKYPDRIAAYRKRNGIEP